MGTKTAFVEGDTRTSSCRHQDTTVAWAMQRLASLDCQTLRRKGRTCLIDLTNPGLWDTVLARLEWMRPGCTDGLEPAYYVVEAADDVRDVTWIKVIGDVTACLGGE